MFLLSPSAANFRNHPDDKARLYVTSGSAYITNRKNILVHSPQLIDGPEEFDDGNSKWNLTRMQEDRITDYSLLLPGEMISLEYTFAVRRGMNCPRKPIQIQRCSTLSDDQYFQLKDNFEDKVKDHRMKRENIHSQFESQVQETISRLHQRVATLGNYVQLSSGLRISKSNYLEANAQAMHLEECEDRLNEIRMPSILSSAQDVGLLE